MLNMFSLTDKAKSLKLGTGPRKSEHRNEVMSNERRNKKGLKPFENCLDLSLIKFISLAFKLRRVSIAVNH